jgi:hypothetical protein
LKTSFFVNRPEFDSYEDEEDEAVIWETEGTNYLVNSTVCSLTSHGSDPTTSPSNTAIINVNKYKMCNNRRLSPRPAVVRTTWCDFSATGDAHGGFYNNNINNICELENQDELNFENQLLPAQQTLVAEHSVGTWNVNNKEELENDPNLFLPDDFSAIKEGVLNKMDDPYQDVYYDHINQQEINVKNADNYKESAPDVKKGTEKADECTTTALVRRKSSKRKRVFQKFWCAAEEDEDDVQKLPRPDAYRLKSSRTGSIQKRNKIGSSLKRKLLGNELGSFAASEYLGYGGEDNDERGGIRRRPKIWEYLDKSIEEEMKKDAKVYAPKRPPPILDLVMVCTSFLVASILAYYSAT